MHGFIVIDKPLGATSFSMVSLVRRLTGVRRVGHAGTLDPLATGVLPVAVGQAARLIEYMDDAPKVYEAVVCLGTTTDTYDAEGTVTAVRDASAILRRDVEIALSAFIGDIAQTPPMFSAIKVAGKPLYRYAREGATDVRPAPRIVRIDRIDLGSYDRGQATLVVTCGKGTYIRSLAHDLGQRLGCGAHLAALRRTSSGGFTTVDARTPEVIASLAAATRLGDAILAPDRAVERRPAVIVGEAHALDLRQGRDIDLVTRAHPAICRAYDVEGAFVGVVASGERGIWHPAKVLPLA